MRDKISMRIQILAAASLLAATGPAPAYAQSALDQANRALQQPELMQATPDTVKQKPPVEVQTDDTSRSAMDVGSGVMVGAVHVEGAHNIPAEAFSSAIAPYLGKALSNADIATLCRAVADIARKEGLAFATAYVPSQTLTLGVLTVHLDEGVISRIQVNGTKNRQVLRTFDKLTGHAPTASETERQIMLVSDIPGIKVRKVSFVRLGGQGVLLVDIQESRMAVSLGLDNYGGAVLGPVRAMAVVELNSVIASGDKITVQALNTPVEPKELAFVALKFDLPIGTDDTVMSGTATYSHVRPSGILNDFDVKARSYDLSLAVRQPLSRSRRLSLWVGAGFDYISSTQDILGFSAIDDRLATLSLSLNGDAALFGGRLRAGVALTRGLAILNASREGDFLSSRPAADAAFTKLVLTADWTGDLAPGVGMRIATTTQITSGPLLSAEQVALGGPSFGRAFDYSTLSGDYGTMASFELHHDFMRPLPLFDWVQPYAFIDGGTIKSIGGTGDTTLISGGGGVRAAFGKFHLTVEGAAPLKTNEDTSALKPRVNVQILRQF